MGFENAPMTSSTSTVQQIFTGQNNGGFSKLVADYTETRRLYGLDGKEAGPVARNCLLARR
jgi:hypothetical protein